MKTTTIGHKYTLDSRGGGPSQTLQFIEEIPTAEGSNDLRTVNDGTTNKEVLKVLINRMQYLAGNYPARKTQSL